MSNENPVSDKLSEAEFLALRRTHNIYYNRERREAFNRLKGKTILIEQLDPEGTPFKKVVAIPDTIRDFTYLAFDSFVEQIDAIEDEGLED